MFFETSAKSAENVEETFIHATKVIHNNVVRGDVYDLANESIGIKPGNTGANRHPATEAAGKRLGGERAAGIQKKKKGCC